MLTKDGEINRVPIPNCPMCKGSGEPLEADKKKGILKCPCILHAHICPHFENLQEANGDLQKLKSLIFENYKICDCKEFLKALNY